MSSTTYGIAHQLWPSDTQIQASSFHDPDPTVHVPIFAIDNNLTTWWEDDTLGQYPDILTLVAPSPSFADLTGLMVVSQSLGWIVDYSVDVYTDNNWKQAATVSGVSANFSTVDFATDGNLTSGGGGAALANVQYIRISVTKTFDNGNPDLTRVTEVYPIFADNQSSGTPSSSSSVASGTSTPSSNNNNNHHKSSSGALIGGVVGGICGALLILSVLVFFFWRRRRQRRQQQGGNSPEHDGSTNTHKEFYRSSGAGVGKQASVSELPTSLSYPGYNNNATTTAPQELPPPHHQQPSYYHHELDPNSNSYYHHSKDDGGGGDQGSPQQYYYVNNSDSNNNRHQNPGNPVEAPSNLPLEDSTHGDIDSGVSRKRTTIPSTAIGGGIVARKSVPSKTMMATAKTTSSESTSESGRTAATATNTDVDTGKATGSASIVSDSTAV